MMDKQQLRREKLLFQYTSSLETGNIERTIQIIHEAQDDPILDRMLADLDATLLEHHKSPATSTANNTNHAHSEKDNPMISITKPTPISIDRVKFPTTLVAAILITVLAGGLLFFVSNPPPQFFANGGITPIQQDTSTTEDSIFADYINEVWANGNTIDLASIVTENHILSSGDEATIGTTALQEIVDDVHNAEVDFTIEIAQLDIIDETNASATVTLTILLDSLDLPITLPEEFSTLSIDTLFTMRREGDLIAQTNIEIDDDGLDEFLANNPLSDLVDISDLLILDFSMLGSSNAEDTTNLSIPDLPECETNVASGLLNDTFAVPQEGTEVATVFLYVPAGLFTIEEGTEDESNIFEADVTYQGAINFEASEGADKLIRILQNNNCLGYSLASVDVLLSPDVPITTQFVVTSGNLDADLRGLEIEKLEALLISGFFEVILSDTESPSLVDIQVSSGTLELTVPENANPDNMTVDVSSGIASILIEDNVSLTADLSLASGLMSIEVPSDTGLQINVTGSALGSFEIAEDMREVENGVWQSDNFETSDYQVIINLSYATGGVEINR